MQVSIIPSQMPALMPGSVTPHLLELSLGSRWGRGAVPGGIVECHNRGAVSGPQGLRGTTGGR